MHPITLTLFPLLTLAAAGYSFVWLLAGGSVFGAFVIYVIARMMGK